MGDKARELIDYYQRNGRYGELVAAVEGFEANLRWKESEEKSQIPNPKSQEKGTQEGGRPVESPFFVGGRINDPGQFFGRERLIRELHSELKKRMSVSLEGEAQVGKSSLLYYLFKTQEKWLPGVTVAFIDMQRVWDEEDFCRTVLAALGERGKTPRALKKVLENRPAVLLFDEMERFAQKDFDPRWHDLLRSLAQEPHLALCLATQRPLVEVFAPRVAGGVSPFHNIFAIKQLGPFSEGEARAFLSARLHGTGVTFSLEEVEEMVVKSGGRPAVLQRLAYGLFERYVG
jgi:hypothetical protein